jgi:hypothetical protein
LAGATESIECHAGYFEGPTRVEYRHPANVRTMVSLAAPTANHNIINMKRIDWHSRKKRVQYLTKKMLRMDVVQRA